MTTFSLEALEVRTRSSDIVANLRYQIVTGVLPAGQRVTETQLAEQLGVSRQPLREAIRELVQARLLVQEPYRSLRVRTFTRKELMDLFSFRISLERFAFTELWSRRTEEDCVDLRSRLQFLTDSCQAQNDRLAIEAEINLHSWCFEVANNSHLSVCWIQLVPLLQYYHHLCHKSHPGCGPISGIHQDYVDLACGEDLSQMLAMVETHIEQGRANILQQLEGLLLNEAAE